MESILSATTTVPLSKTLSSNFNPLLYRLHRRLPTETRPSRLSTLRLSRLFNSEFPLSSNFGSVPSSSYARILSTVHVPSARLRAECVSSSAASFASGGGGSIGGSGGDESGGGGGDGGADSGDAKANEVVNGAEDGSVLSSDVIILDVGGMTCGGCAASVKRILESQPQVSSASVNLTTEMAIVWPVLEAKVAPNWQKHLGDALAKHLTSCGFKSNLRGQGATEGDTPS